MQVGMLLSGITECDNLVYSEIGKDLAVRTVLFYENHFWKFVYVLLMFILGNFFLE